MGTRCPACCRCGMYICRGCWSLLGLQYDLDALIFLVAEHLVALRRLVQVQAMRDYKGWVDSPLLDVIQERPHIALDVGLAHLQGQALVERRADRSLVDDAAVHARDGNCTTLATGLNGHAQRSRTVGLHAHLLLCPIVEAIEARTMGFHADCVDAEQKDAAEQFIDFLQTPKNQRRVLAYGFRPGNPAVSVADPIISANGVDPDQPQTLLDVPTPAVLDGLLTSWAENRKKARVLLVLDVSGSMGEGVDNNDGDTKLDLAKQATIDALESFKSEDEVGLRIFSTGLGPDQSADYLDLQPLQPIGASREALARSIDGLFPTNGTPLYTVAQAAFDDMIASYDPASINAVILLTDGANDDSDQSDDNRQRDELLASLRAKSSGENATPIRVFTVAYGANATTDALRQIAEASNAAFYSASDAATIKTVFAQVVSNF